MIYEIINMIYANFTMEIYHVLNRGVDKRKIFLDDMDHLRFIHDLFEFNDQEPINNTFYHFNKNNDFVNPYIGKERHKRKLIVNIHAFCLMPNHYHILISPLVEGAITRFMRRMNVGYANYFNQKYERSGALFQGRYKSAVVKSESHFIHLPYYIHLNPLDIKFSEWRNRELSNFKNAKKFLEKYRWSSHLDYLGQKNFPSVTQRDLLLKFFDGENNYNNSIYKWLNYLEISDMKNILLE